MARLRVFAGPNGSGKSTLLGILPAEYIGTYVNADDLERAIRTHGNFDLADYNLGGEAPARFERLLAALRGDAGRLEGHEGSLVADHMSLDGTRVSLPAVEMNSYIAATLADFLRFELLDAGVSFTFETVMSHESKVEFMAEARRRGYRTYLYFIATEDVDINVDRVEQRVALGGHPVAEANIKKRYPKTLALLQPACDAADRAYVFDNSGDAHRLVAEITNGEQLEVHTDDIPAWFVNTELWQSFQM